MLRGLTAKEVIARARETGLDMSARTFRLYVDLGLVPRPSVRSNPRGGRSGYYESRVVGLLRAIVQLQAQGQTLQQVKAFLDRLADIARSGGRDPLEVQLEAAEALADGDHAGAGGPKGGQDPLIWRSVGGPLMAELMRHGHRPDPSAVAELRLQAVLRDGERVEVPLFLSPAAVVHRHPTRRDDAALGFITAAHETEVEGKDRPPVSATRMRDWLEHSTDISRPNFFVAARAAQSRRPTDEASTLLGFAALGVEPERLRAGQVRLEGPYVVPEYRGQGLGRALLEQAEARALELGAGHIDASIDASAARAAAFLRHFGYHPAFFYWVAEMDLARTAAERLEHRLPKRATSRLEIRPVGDRVELDAHLVFNARVRAGTPGFYPLTVADLAGLSLPSTHLFDAYLDGRLVGVSWHSLGGPRVYVNVLPEYGGTWVETALWAHLLRYAAGQGLKRVRTEAAGASEAAAQIVISVGFAIDSMRVCYRKRFKEAGSP